MRRPIGALVSGILMLALLPGSSLAFYPHEVGVLDQANTTNAGAYGTDNAVAQTFTAGQDGVLTDVKLYLLGSGGSTSVELCDATGANCSAWSQSAVAGASYSWVDFAFNYIQPVTKGTKYSLVFNMSSLGATYDAGYSDTDVYTAGEAMEFQGGSWVTPPMAGVLDFNFQTLVSPQTSTLAWDKTQITAGQTTQLVLTETYAFPAYYGAAPNVAYPAGPSGAILSVKPDALPAWFTATQVACSAQIATSDCTLPNATNTSGSIPVTRDGQPITITLTGNAAASSAGTITSRVEGCAQYSLTQTVCIPATADIQVVAASPTARPSATPPPTSSAPTDGNSGPSLGFLLLMLTLAGFAAVAATLSGSRRNS